MIGDSVGHYRILEKLGEVRLGPRSGRDETRPGSISQMGVDYGW